jgi:hypothetical protein
MRMCIRQSEQDIGDYEEDCTEYGTERAQTVAPVIVVGGGDRCGLLL